jgi:hypothetical protein
MCLFWKRTVRTAMVLKLIMTVSAIVLPALTAPTAAQERGAEINPSQLPFAASLPATPASNSSFSSSPLSKDEVVDNLVRRNQERTQALLRSESTRIYHLTYRGLGGNHDAEMTVEATYESPATKNFKIIDQSGSKVILNRVFKKLLEGEQEAAEPEIAARTKLDRENYDFQLAGFEPSERGGQYVLEVTPKSTSKFVYHGRIWVDAADFAVTHIQAEPAQNPSFWTKKNEIRHDYKKFGDFWLPVKNESVSYIRLGGVATLTIEYKDYRVTDGRMLVQNMSR